VTDPILSARVDALRHSLELVQYSVELIDQMLEGGQQSPEVVPRELRDNLRGHVDSLVTSCVQGLDQVDALHRHDGGGEPAAAWTQYALVQERSEALFSGCLEFIGGCAFRRELGRSDADREDRRIAEVADRLMIEAAGAALGRTRPFLTVPALEDALADSRVRTIRLRFPDWTLWNLPLMAYDFGHVAISEMRGDEDDDAPLMRLLERKAKEVVEHDNELGERLTGKDANTCERLERRALKAAADRIRVLCADAFAARWMGPAYGCAALHLRFDPSAAFQGSPCYEERAQMVLRTLGSMATEPEHRELVETLAGNWKRAVEQADPPDPNSAPPLEVVELVHDELLQTLDEMSDAARFTPRFWSEAQTKYEAWAGQKSKGHVLKTQPDPGEKIRVVLNAAWLARSGAPDNAILVEQIARAAMKQCLTIAQTPIGGGRRGDGGGAPQKEPA
jgi:hypothetical protein